MSDTKDDKWQMPKPVFRSSEGGLPKSFEETISQTFTHDDLRNAAAGDEDYDDDILSLNELPTLQPNKPEGPSSEDNTDEASSEEVVDDHAEPADPEEAADAQAEAIVETEPKRSTFWSFTTIFLVIVIVAAAIVAGVLYFVRSGSGDSTFR